MILTSFFYKTKLSLEQYSEVDFKRFRPAASFEVFPVWREYILKNFPDEQILFFNSASPIPFEEGAKSAGITDYEIIPENSYTYDNSKQYYVKNLPKIASNYSFYAVQKQRVEALKFAYLNNLDFKWIDLDCLINSPINDRLKDVDIAANDFSHEYMSIDGHFLYISKERLHSLDNICNIIEFLEGILNGPEDKIQGYKSHILFEGGIFKLFGFGNMKKIDNISIIHASCLNNFKKWLFLNPLDTDNYRNLIKLLNNLNMSKLKDYLLDFEDTFEIKDANK